MAHPLRFAARLCVGGVVRQRLLRAGCWLLFSALLLLLADEAAAAEELASALLS